MTKHHGPFKALGPIDWDQVPKGDLKPFLDDIFANAQTIIESIPSGGKGEDTTGRSRAKTESAIGVTNIKASLALRPSQEALADASHLRKEWKEVKVNPRENPLDVVVYKLSAKDGKGAWFARRSTHEGLDFEQWKLGLEREFHESMKVQEGPGSGNIRGIGAERRVEHRSVENAGQLDVYQLSAQFPGPTSPRDFITLFLTSDFSHTTNDDGPPPLRQYMIVSKPCNHPDTPPRQGIIRGQYESVEIVREVLIDNPTTKRSLSSTDLPSEGGKESARPRTVAIEWLMVTRSDPGGSVPRFMIERGTPPGIVGDAGKFLDWVKSKSPEDLSKPAEAEAEAVGSGTLSKSADATPLASNAVGSRSETDLTKLPSRSQDASAANHDIQPDSVQAQHDEATSGYSGLYGMILGVFGAATSVATGLRRQLVNPVESLGMSESFSSTPTVPEQDEEERNSNKVSEQGEEKTNGENVPESLRDDSSTEVSSIYSFTSALENRDVEGMSQESRSDESKSQNQSHEKDLKKLQERRRKIDEKVAKMHERYQSKRQEESQRDAAAQAKAREKYEREIAKHEAKYKREVKRLEEKREHEQRRAEDKRRKAAEREEKGKLSLELEKARAERDYARKQMQLLQSQVGELQAQNTQLVARLGRLGVIDRSDSSSTSLQDMSTPASTTPNGRFASPAAAH